MVQDENEKAWYCKAGGAELNKDEPRISVMSALIVSLPSLILSQPMTMPHQHLLQ